MVELNFQTHSLAGGQAGPKFQPTFELEKTKAWRTL